MNNHKNHEENPKQLKRRLAVALVMLLISSLLMTTTSYAWLVLSVAPEVTGITMNVGANGSLEIALLNTDTRQDMTTIRSGVIGESLATGSYTANFTWGNLLDLSSDLFGMENIILLPARIQANPNTTGDGYTVGSGLLSIPTYGYDGRIVDLSDDTVSAIYAGEAFSFILGQQDYGVRAIGTSDTLSVQAAALALAKSNIVAYTNAAAGDAKSSLAANGEALFGIMLQHMTDDDGTFNDEQLQVVKNMIDALENSLKRIETTLRQGLVAVAASRIGDEDQFTLVRDRINNTTSLSDLLDDLAEVGEVPTEYDDWVAKLAGLQNDLNQAINSCAELNDGEYTWEELSNALNHLMDLNKIYINDTLFPDFDKSTAMDLIGTDIILTLGPGSGIYASIADFTDNFSTIISAVGSSVEIKTSTTEKPVYLVALYESVKDLEAAEGGAEGSSVVLSTTYGYALDMAFRCNAPLSDLLLQTAAVQRVYDGSTSAATMGGGSYMQFTSMDENLTLAQRILLMDAIRVGFIDDQGNLLAVAKLNTSNRITENGVIKAPLYLYDYSFSEEDGSMVMGERRKTDNKIMSLDQNIAKALTAVVWLDGDVVDNTMVSATEATSLNGTLNLQFASSADLIPAVNEAYMNITANRIGLEAALADAEEIYLAGQGNAWTTASWIPFAAAYEHAQAVLENEDANDTMIYNAVKALAETKAALAPVTHETLSGVISFYRAWLGKTSDEAWIVVKTDDGVKGLAEFTDEQYEAAIAKIYRVDYDNNLQDEGNDVYTPIYTDESWSTLAAALYAAEVVDMDDNATGDEINAAILALETAENALQRRVYYIPYEYNAQLYYFAISDETDTYGKWYDNQFKRIISDKTILDLDAYAEPAEIATIEQDRYVAYEADDPDYRKYISPWIEIRDDLFNELRGEEVIAIQWKVNDLYMYEGPTDSQRSALYNLIREAEDLLEAGVEDENWRQWLTEDLADAEEIYDLGKYVHREEVETAITILQQDIDVLTYEETVVDPAVEPMTMDQRTVLTAAVNAAMAIPGYDDTTNTELDNLRTAVTAVQALLAEDATPTMEQANTALTGLNALMVAAGGKEVTAYNTLVHTLPMGSERFDVVYAVDQPTVPMILTGEWGLSTVSAVVLTDSGILFTVEVPVEVYSPAEDVNILNPEGNVEEYSYTYWDADAFSNPSLYIGQTFKLDTELNERTIRVYEDNSNYDDWYTFWVSKLQSRGVTEYYGSEPVWNGTTLEHDYYFYRDYGFPNGETIKSATWASSDTSVATVAPDGTVTIKQVKDFTITVSVETTQGNTYSTSIVIVLSVDPDAPVEDPTEPE